MHLEVYLDLVLNAPVVYGFQPLRAVLEGDFKNHYLRFDRFFAQGTTLKQEFYLIGVGKNLDWMDAHPRLPGIFDAALAGIIAQGNAEDSLFRKIGPIQVTYRFFLPVKGEQALLVYVGDGIFSAFGAEVGEIPGGEAREVGDIHHLLQVRCMHDHLVIFRIIPRDGGFGMVADVGTGAIF